MVFEIGPSTSMTGNFLVPVSPIVGPCAGDFRGSGFRLGRNSVSEYRVFPATRPADKEPYVIIANKREIKSRALRRLLALKEITQQILTALDAL
jgi:hypothetical protein